MKPEIKEAMSKELITIPWNAEMRAAFRKMRGWDIRHLPVVDENGGVVGILSDRDVQRAMRFCDSRDAAAVVEEAEFADGAIVRDYMSWPVLSLEVSDDIRSAAGRMIREKISSFLVVDRGRPVGIITTEEGGGRARDRCPWPAPGGTG
jgi:acetoin utilization protein AcuB